MEARAVARYIRISPRKVRRTLQLVTGLPLREAQSLLDVMPHRAARAIRRVVDSAAANAENNQDMTRDDLWVARAFVDAGPTLKRWRFASGGRVAMIRKRISHISVVLSDEER
ncbi:MAG: 50S ribosomal protein L22 [Planctomycetota bacterium]|jgi:large subunit ribosomal protein L22